MYCALNTFCKLLPTNTTISLDDLLFCVVLYVFVYFGNEILVARNDKYHFLSILQIKISCTCKLSVRRSCEIKYDVSMLQPIL